MDIYETTQAITAKALAILPDGSVRADRTHVAGMLVHLLDRAEAEGLVAAGVIRPAPPLQTTTPAQLERARAEVDVSSRALARERAALADADTRAREVEASSDDRSELERAWNDQRFHKLRVERAQKVEADAREALAKMELGAALAEGLQRVAEQRERRREQEAAIEDIRDLIAVLKSKTDALVEMEFAGGAGGDLAALQAEVRIAVLEKCQQLGVRPAELAAWLVTP